MNDLLSGKVKSLECAGGFLLSLVGTPTMLPDSALDGYKPFQVNQVPQQSPAQKPAPWTPGGPPPSFDWMTKPLEEIITAPMPAPTP